MIQFQTYLILILNLFIFTFLANSSILISKYNTLSIIPLLLLIILNYFNFQVYFDQFIQMQLCTPFNLDSISQFLLKKIMIK